MPLVVEHLQVAPGGGPAVLDDLSFRVRPGERLAIVGRNGSGKSTLARALAGLVATDAGSVSVGGGPAGRGGVGLILQDPSAQAIAATVADDLALGPQAAGRAPAQVVEVVVDVLDALGLRMLAARDPHELSGGQQQRLAAGAVVACDVAALVLDEPTAMVDPAARPALHEAILRLAGERPLCWITQEPDELALCTSVLVLDGGRASWHGPVADLVQDEQLAAAMGIELPAASRLAHRLRREGSWPADEAVPSSDDELVSVLASHRARDDG